MTAKNYEKTCARMVSEAIHIAYASALRLVREHQTSHPDSMPAQTRALALIDNQDGAGRTHENKEQGQRNGD